MNNKKTIIDTFFNQVTRQNNAVNLFYIACSIGLFLILDEFKSYNYLLFHSIAEMISVVSSFVIFSIVLFVWEDLRKNNYLSLLGIAFFYIGWIDALHLLAYSGMPIFNAFDSDLASQLWILGRYLQAFSLLVGGLLIRRKRQIHKWGTLSLYTLVAGISLTAIFYWRTFPPCFIEGYGLTMFKIMSEYIICILFMISGILILKQRDFFKQNILGILLLSILFQIIAELAFTTYISVYEFSNFLGHYFKILSVMIFCKAILITAMESPNYFLYEKLKKKQQQLKEAQRIGNMGSWELNILTGTFRCSSQTERILEWGHGKGELSYENFLEMIHPEDQKSRMNLFENAINSKKIYESIHRLLLSNGEGRVVHERGELSYNQTFDPRKINCIIKDITEFKSIEEGLKKSEERFRIMFEQAPLGIALIDSFTGHILEVNSRFAEIAGRSVEEMTVIDWMSITHPDDVQEDLDQMTRMNAHQINGFNMNKRYIHRDGTIVWIHMTIAPLRIQDDEDHQHLCMIEDITESIHVHERLEKYKILSEKANDAMLFIDREGMILEANDAAIKLYGYTVETLLSMSVFDLRRTEKKPYINQQMELADKEGIIFETIHYRKDGTTIPVEVSSKGTFLGNKRVFLSIMRDVTERKKAEEEILIALRKAEDANAAKSQFLANMSHEIRTPMNGIMGMTDLTLMTEISEEQRDYLSMIKSSTQSLLRVVNDILDYSKIEAGKIDIEKVSFDLENTIHEVMDLFAIGAKEKGLLIRLNFNERIPRQIIGDSVRLRQVLSNLVGNGIKFTDQGEIVITIDMEEQDDSEIKLRFMVFDTGIGIPEDKRDKLFKRFSQIDDSHTRQFGGTGLGLAISKRLVEMMGGEIGVESQENVGSCFFFTTVFGLQVELGNVVDENVLDQIPTQPNKITMKKVLLAEDDVVSQHVVTIMLKEKGFHVIAVVNGQEAVNAFEKENFDVILMDINMPYLDGYSATGMIRLQEERLNIHTPIIAMTACALQGDREKCLQAGMDDYISKPVNFTEILDKIEKYTKGSNREKQQFKNKDIFNETVIALMAAADFDKETSELILYEFCGQATKLMNGIKKHVAQQNFLEAGILLHQLKGSAGNVRAKEIAKYAFEAEEVLKLKDVQILTTLLEKIERVVMTFVESRKEKGVQNGK